jgi:hypothetical protein
MKETPPWRRTSRDRADGRCTPLVPRRGQGRATMAPHRPPGVARRCTMAPRTQAVAGWPSSTGMSQLFLNAAGGHRRRHCRPCRRPSQIRPWVGGGFGQGMRDLRPPRRLHRRSSTPSSGSPTAARRKSGTGEAGSGRRNPSSTASPPSKTWPARVGRSAPPPRSGAAAGRKALPPPSLRPARRPGRPLWRR